MEEQIKAILIQEEGYSPHSAEITSTDLAEIKDAEISQALIRWIDNGQKTNIARGPFSCQTLMNNYRMKYPATLIFLDWYKEDPQAAVAAIHYSEG